MINFLCCQDRNDGVEADPEYAEGSPFEEESRAQAATKIQAVQRGKAGRAQASARKAEIEAYKNASGNAGAAEELGDADGVAAAKLLCIDIISAKTLRNCVGGLMNRKSSPFVKCNVGGVSFSTQIIKGNLNPKWEESFEVVDYTPGTDVTFEVFHPAVGKKPEICLGKAVLAAAAFAGDEGCAQDLTLTETGLKKGGSTLNIKVAWQSARTTEKRISAFKEMPVEQWIVRYRPIGLRHGPGVSEKRVNVDLKPGEEFGVVELVEGADGQSYLRLSDGRGWAFTKSPKDGELLCERLDAEPETVIEDAGDATVGAEANEDAVANGNGEANGKAAPLEEQS